MLRNKLIPALAAIGTLSIGAVALAQSSFLPTSVDPNHPYELLGPKEPTYKDNSHKPNSELKSEEDIKSKLPKKAQLQKINWRGDKEAEAAEMEE